MRYQHVPTQTEVVMSLRSFGRPATAKELCDDLSANRPRRDCQLAIQRAIESGAVTVGDGWLLTP